MPRDTPSQRDFTCTWGATDTAQVVPPPCADNADDNKLQDGTLALCAQSEKWQV